MRMRRRSQGRGRACGQPQGSAQRAALSTKTLRRSPGPVPAFKQGHAQEARGDRLRARFPGSLAASEVPPVLGLLPAFSKLTGRGLPLAFGRKRGSARLRGSLSEASQEQRRASGPGRVSVPAPQRNPLLRWILARLAAHQQTEWRPHLDRCAQSQPAVRQGSSDQAARRGHPLLAADQEK